MLYSELSVEKRATIIHDMIAMPGTLPPHFAQAASAVAA